MSRRGRIRDNYRNKVYPKLYNEYSVGTITNQTDECYALKNLLKSLDLIILNYSKKNWGRASKKSNIEGEHHLVLLKEIRKIREGEFGSKKCNITISNSQILDVKEIINTESKEYNLDIKKEDKPKKYIYYGIGVSIMLAGMFIILKKKK
jgi:hypothetical protein